MNKLIVMFATMFIFSLFSYSSYACTDFKVVGLDGTIMITRSMEFAADMKANLRSSNRNRQFAETAPDGKPAMSWKAKYGYLFIDGFDLDYTVDGINENGLSFEYLYLPGETQYPLVPQGKNNEALPYMRLGDFILGNFKSVDEVKAALSHLIVFQQNLPGVGDMVFPLHAAVFDASGKGLVIEFVNGKMNVHDNIGIMTNSPTYDWHVVDLQNYLNLSAYVPKPVTVAGNTYSATGQGTGSIGLPGDPSPTSRFVKVAFMLHNAYAVNNTMNVLNLSEHIINNVDIPSGIARAISNGKETADMTQWVVFKDLTHKTIYYRTYGDMTLHQVDMNKISFSETAPRLKMPLADKPTVLDVTDKFAISKAAISPTVAPTPMNAPANVTMNTIQMLPPKIVD